ncbi:MAG: hypothetical protein LBL90_08420 [Prevotellaceae bacterium]|jgi:hypothetical protein|nr:hypothetical protein [Prevotellaceae bacterium]
MKKLLLILLVALVANGCGFKSKEAPIEGTENLVTYTIKGSKQVGVKEKGEQGKFILPAMFTNVEAYAGFLFGKTADSPETYGIYHLNGKSMADINKATILKEDENYRVVQFPNGPKWIISPIQAGEMYSGEEAYISGNTIFGKVSGKWNIFGVSATGYSKIIVATAEGKACYITQKIMPLMTDWYIWLQETPTSAKLLQCYYAPKLKKIVEEIEANLPPAREQNADGIISFYDFDVSKYIAPLM